MTASQTKLTPPEVARRYGISPDKVLFWIRSGEFRAVNVATRANGRPRYIIDDADIAEFEHRRVAQKAPTPRRRRKPANVVE